MYHCSHFKYTHMFQGCEIFGWMWTSELSNAPGQRVPWYWMESLWWREISWLSAICCICQWSDLCFDAVSLCCIPFIFLFINDILFLAIGESVEENANVVVRLLIRRPECFGPALRGEGGNGLLAAIEEAIKISEDPARDGPSTKKDRRFPM